MKKIYLMMLMITVAFSSMGQSFTKEEKEAAEKDLTKASITPNGNGGLSNVFSSFSLSSKLNAGTDGKAELKFKRADYVGGLELTQTIGKGDEEATLYDFINGFKSGTKIGINFQGSNWIKSEYSPADKKFLEAAFAKIMKKDPNAKREQLSEGDITDEEDLKVLKTLRARKLLVWNIKAALTKTKFSYAIDSVSLKKLDETHFRPDITASVGLPFNNISYLSISYNYSESFESNDKMEFFKPFGTSPNLVSQTIAFGKPKYKNDHKAVLEYRRLVFDSSFAISPSITYGVNSEKIAFALPVYFIKNTDAEGKSTGLQGGISAGYLSNVNKFEKFKDGFAAQLFVSAPFSLFKAF